MRDGAARPSGGQAKRRGCPEAPRCLADVSPEPSIAEEARVFWAAVEHAACTAAILNVRCRLLRLHEGPKQAVRSYRALKGAVAATYRIMDDLIVEATEQVDEDALAQQLGLK